MSCLLPHPPPRCLSHTHVLPLHARPFVCFPGVCLLPHAYVWARLPCQWSGVRALSWLLKSASALLLALLQSLCCDLGLFLELPWTLLTAGRTHFPPLMGF